MYSRQATDSVNCENSSVTFVMKYCPTSTDCQKSSISTKTETHDVVVIAFPLVLGTFATMDHIVMPKQISLFSHGKLCILHTNLRLSQLDGLTSTVSFPRHPTLTTNTSERRQHDDDADDKRGETFHFRTRSRRIIFVQNCSWTKCWYST